MCDASWYPGRRDGTHVQRRVFPEDIIIEYICTGQGSKRNAGQAVQDRLLLLVVAIELQEHLLLLQIDGVMGLERLAGSTGESGPDHIIPHHKQP